jgi:hypothetical protein
VSWICALFCGYQVDISSLNPQTRSFAAKTYLHRHNLHQILSFSSLPRKLLSCAHPIKGRPPLPFRKEGSERWKYEKYDKQIGIFHLLVAGSCLGKIV